MEEEEHEGNGSERRGRSKADWQRGYDQRPFAIVFASSRREGKQAEVEWELDDWTGWNEESRLQGLARWDEIVAAWNQDGQVPRGKPWHTGKGVRMGTGRGIVDQAGRDTDVEQATDTVEEYARTECHDGERAADTGGTNWPVAKGKKRKKEGMGSLRPPLPPLFSVWCRLVSPREDLFCLISRSLFGRFTRTTPTCTHAFSWGDGRHYGSGVRVSVQQLDSWNGE